MIPEESTPDEEQPPVAPPEPPTAPSPVSAADVWASNVPSPRDATPPAPPATAPMPLGGNNDSLSPHPEKVAPIVSRPSPSSPEGPSQGTPWWQSLTVRLPLGIALSFVAGTTVWWLPQLWGSGDMFDSEGALSSVVIVSFVLVFAAGVLLRSVWALLVVPVAWALGETAALAVGVLTVGGGDWTYFWPTTITLLQLSVLPVAFAAGLGMMLGMWLRQRGRTTRKHGSLPA